MNVIKWTMILWSVGCALAAVLVMVDVGTLHSTASPSMQTVILAGGLMGFMTNIVVWAVVMCPLALIWLMLDAKNRRKQKETTGE